MAELKISQMTQATEEQLTDGALMEVAVEDGNSSTGYSTKSGSLARLKEYAIGELADELLANQNGGYVRKNLLKNTTGSATQNGITFTVNADDTVVANGTNSGNSFVRYIDTNATDWSGQSLILSGCPAGGSTSTYALRVHEAGSGKGYDTGSGLAFTGASNNRIGIFVAAGATLNNVTFKPMVRPATIEDSTYVPFAASNSTLTKLSQFKVVNTLIQVAFNAQRYALAQKDISQDGWTPLGIVGHNCSSVDNTPYQLFIEGNTANVALWRASAYTGSVNFYIRVLYQRNA